MRFLVDGQLPPALARWLEARGYDAVHVLDRDLAKADDRLLWELASIENRILVSKDEDFFILATRPADTGRVLWVRVGNCRKQALLDALDGSWSLIEQAFVSGQRIVEVR